MRNHDCTSGKILKTFLKSTDSVHIHIIGRLVKKKHVTFILEGQRKMETVSFTTREDAAELLLISS